MNLLASAAVVGIDVGWILSLDPLLRDFAEEIIYKAVEISQKRDRRMAQMIIEELAASMSS